MSYDYWKLSSNWEWFGKHLRCLHMTKRYGVGEVRELTRFLSTLAWLYMKRRNARSRGVLQCIAFLKTCITTTNSFVYVYGLGLVVIDLFVDFENLDSHMIWFMKSRIRSYILASRIRAQLSWIKNYFIWTRILCKNVAQGRTWGGGRIRVLHFMFFNVSQWIKSGDWFKGMKVWVFELATIHWPTSRSKVWILANQKIIIRVTIWCHNILCSYNQSKSDANIDWLTIQCRTILCLYEQLNLDA